MSFPAVPQWFTYGSIRIRLWVPQVAPQRFKEPPYWAQVWPAAKALAAFIAENPGEVKGKYVVELGAGLGLPSLVAAHFTEGVLITDKNTEAVEWCARAAAGNGLHRVRCAVMDWKHLPPGFEPGVLLLSDVNYEPAAFESLQVLITKLVHGGTVVLLSTPQRLVARAFLQPLLPLVKQSGHQVIEHMGDMVDVSVFVLA